MKKQVPSIITTICGVFMFLVIMLHYFERVGAEEQINRMLQMMGTVPLFLGMFNLWRIHTTQIAKKRTNWMFSAWLLFVMFAYAALGMIQGNKGVTYRYLYDAVIVPVDSTMYATVAYFICSGAYRAFRVKSVESIIMMSCAVWVMLANVPLGDFIWPSSGWLGGMEGIKNWLMNVPNSAASRAIGVGAFFGAFATQLRVFLGVERRHLGSG